MFWHTARANRLRWSWEISFGFVLKLCPSEIPGSLRGNLRGNPCVGMGQPLQEGFAWSTSTLCSATRACPTQTPTGSSSVLVRDTKTCLHLTRNTQVSGFIVTWLLSTDKNKPHNILERRWFSSRAFAFARRRSHVSPLWSRRCNYENRGCSTSPSAAPESHPAAAQPGRDGELCTGSPAVPGAAAACLTHPPAEQGCWPRPAAPPATVALPVTFTSAS